MNNFKQHIIPLAAFIITSATALLTYEQLPYVIPYVVFKYPIAIVVLYAFFRFITFTDRKRSTQLDEAGLLRPLRDGAFLFCTYSHLVDLGWDLKILSPTVNPHLSLVSLMVAIIGYYAQEQPRGLPGKLIDLLPAALLKTRTATCKGLTISGLVGIIGTFTALLQPLWLLIPLLVVLIRSYRSGDPRERTK